MSTEIVKSSQSLSVYSSANNFEHAQRIAKMLCSSTLVPAEYQNNLSNTLVALEMANRVGASPLMVMQNLNVIQGRPSWSSPFIIASINSCGRFAPLKFEMEKRGRKTVKYEEWTGSKQQNNRRKETRSIEVDDLACRAVTTDSTGAKIEGPLVTIEMAVQEGWFTKSDSKWRTMPEVMIRYRAAAFFGRMYAPEIMLGMQTSEEINDFAEPTAGAKPGATIINDALKAHQPGVNTANVPEATVVQEQQPAAPADETKPQASRRRTQPAAQPAAPSTAVPPQHTANDEELV